MSREKPGEAGRRSEAIVDYVSALVPPIVMAVAFAALIVTLVKSQGGPNKAKEDAAVDAAFARAEAVRQAAAPAGTGAPGEAESR
jgi:hypothetical protein